MDILGLDISTNTVGIAIVDAKKQISYVDYISTKSVKDLMDKANLIIEGIEAVVDNSKIEQVVIEDNLSAFQSGRTNINSIMKLAKINGIVTFYISQILKLPTISIHPSTARKKVIGYGRVPKLLKPKYPSMKDMVREVLLGRYQDLELPKMKTKDKLASEAYDILDALVVALYYDV